MTRSLTLLDFERRKTAHDTRRLLRARLGLGAGLRGHPHSREVLARDFAAAWHSAVRSHRRLLVHAAAEGRVGRF